MNIINKIFLLLLLMIFLISCVNQEIVGRSFSIDGCSNLELKIKTIQYKSIPGVDPNLLSLDVYYTENMENAPVLIMVHGGGWRKGDKKGKDVVSFKPEHFVQEKCMMFVSINYRLSDRDNIPNNPQHPVHIEDVASAISYIYDNIGKVGGDKESLLVMGHSAGAHLTALLSTDEKYLTKNGKSTDILKGVILLDTAFFDLNKNHAQDEIVDGRNSGKLIENAFGLDEEVWFDASPINQIPNFEFNIKKYIPPTLSFFTKEGFKGDENKRYVNFLNDYGVEAFAVKATEYTHDSINRNIGKREDRVTNIIDKFIESLLLEKEVSDLYIPATLTNGLSGTPILGNQNSEIMNVVEHEGRLFASTGQWLIDERTGPQILVLDSKDSQWSIFEQFADVGKKEVIRSAALESIKFEPGKTFLLAHGEWPINTKGETDGIAYLFNDGSSFKKWHLPSLIGEGGSKYIRSFGSRTENGQHYLYAGAFYFGKSKDHAFIFRGLAKDNGEIEWNADPDFHLVGKGNNELKVTGFADCGNNIFATVGSRIFRRLDNTDNSAKNRWEVVFQSETPNRLIRGLTCIDDSLFFIDSRKFVKRIDNVRSCSSSSCQVSVEADLFEIVDNGLLSIYDKPVKNLVAAYNEFYETSIGGKRVHIFGIALEYDGCPDETFCLPSRDNDRWDTTACYITRFSSSDYKFNCLSGDLKVTADPYKDNRIDQGENFAGIRSIVKSPWEDDVFYMSGPDALGIPNTFETAWIGKVELK